MHELTRCYKNIAHLLIKAWFCINCNEFLLTHLYFTFFTAQIHLSCAPPSTACPFLRLKLCSLKFRVKPSDFTKILKRKEKQGI